ncbi:hypothetical protein LCGC14_1036040 [marine sediment metagenome]|uniref:Thymidylate synthase/dCMP hydroxymethylase domain-containing protein n=1 Tax=marine sediment metagenome TaxID=412755 RepID=A0A0F9NET2_9ZZZZ
MLETILISKHTVEEAWLSSLIEVINNGNLIKTEYDRKDDPPSFDATVMINIKYPLSKPIKRNGKVLTIKSKFGNKYEVYGSIADTYLIGSIQSGYIEEIIGGVNDHLVQESETSYPYSYHDRIFSYSAFSSEDSKHVSHWICKRFSDAEIQMKDFVFPRINQFKYIIKKLKQSGYSRRAQAITWRPYADPYRDDGPCLQRIWCRIIDNKLTMTTTWRSRDLFKAWEANVNGMIQLQKLIAEELEVEVGNYIDISNSLHIYGRDLRELIDILERILKREQKTLNIFDKLQIALQRCNILLKK